MNVVIHSVSGLVFLLGAVFLCGLVLSLIYSLLKSISCFSSVIRCRRFPSYKNIVDCIKTADSTNLEKFVVDFVVCLLFSCLLLSLTFVFNSGNFRLVSFVVMLTGIIIGYRLVSDITDKLVLILLFLIKWFFNVITFPVVWLLQRLIRFVSIVIKKQKISRTNGIIQKYTAHRFERIANDAEYGLIDDYYKELIK